MSDMIDRDAVLALVKAHIKDARRTYAGIHQAQEPLAFVESLMVPAIRALPAASAEDVREGALKEAAALVMQTHRPPSIVKDFRDGYDVAKADIAGAILALIPGAKP